MSKFDTDDGSGLMITYKDRTGRPQTKSADAALHDLRQRDVKATMELSTPLISSQDGPRMAGNLANFGGKRAMPFGKGGKRRMKKNRALKALKFHKSHNFSKPLSKKARAGLGKADFVFPKTRAYPIPDRRHASIAILDSTGTPQNAAVRRAVAKKFGIGKKKK